MFYIFVEHPCHNRGLSWYVLHGNWNYLWLRPISITSHLFVTKSLWGFLYTLHFAQKTGLTHDTACPDVIYIVFLRAALISEKSFRFSHNRCQITYFHHEQTCMDSILTILYRMLKYILAESVIYQQYRTLANFAILSDHFRKQVSESIRSTVGLHQFHCGGGSIFLEGGVILSTCFYNSCFQMSFSTSQLHITTMHTIQVLY